MKKSILLYTALHLGAQLGMWLYHKEYGTMIFLCGLVCSLLIHVFFYHKETRQDIRCTFNTMTLKTIAISLMIAGLGLCFVLGLELPIKHYSSEMPSIGYVLLSAPAQQWMFTIQPAIVLNKEMKEITGNYTIPLIFCISIVTFGSIHCMYPITTMLCAALTLGIAGAYCAIIKQDYVAAVMTHIICGGFALYQGIV